MHEPRELTFPEQLFVDAGVPLEERDTWIAAGFGSVAALNFIGAGASVDEAITAKSLGMSFEDVAEHKRHADGPGIGVDELLARLSMNLDELTALLGRGFSLNAVKSARQAGVPVSALQKVRPEDLESLVPLFELGLDEAEVEHWAATGLHPPAIVKTREASQRSEASTDRAPFGDFVEGLLDQGQLEWHEFLALLAAGCSPEEVVDARKAGATVKLLEQVAPAMRSLKGAVRQRFVTDLLEVLGRGVGSDTLRGWLSDGVTLRKIRRILDRASIDELPWHLQFPKAKERAAWHAATDSADSAGRWHRYAIRPDDLVNGSPSTALDQQMELIAKITSLRLDGSTDYPCEFQAESARDGVFDLTHYELDEDQIFTGDETNEMVSLADVLRAAVDFHVRYLDFGGLDAREAAILLSTPAFSPLTAELIEQCGEGDPLQVNGVQLVLRDGVLADVVEPDQQFDWQLDETATSSEDGARWIASGSIPYIGPTRREWTVLYLSVYHDEVGKIVWDASISEEDAGFGDAALDSGTATSIAAAKAACEEAALTLIRQQLS